MKEYTYNIIDDVYHWMISRRKDIEVRILKEISKAIQVGDIIIFNNQDSIGKYVKIKVVNKIIVDNIEELTGKFDVDRMM